MSTRGAMGFRVDGQDKVTFNHFDSYPEGMGVEILRAARAAGEMALAKTARAIKLVDQGKISTYAELVGMISEGKGTFVQYDRFLANSLFCEWAYIINLDQGLLEVYIGFNKDKKAAGRYAKRQDKGSDYHGVRLVKTYALAHLPEDTAFTDELQRVFKEAHP